MGNQIKRAETILILEIWISLERTKNSCHLVPLRVWQERTGEWKV